MKDIIQMCKEAGFWDRFAEDPVNRRIAIPTGIAGLASVAAGSADLASDILLERGRTRNQTQRVIDKLHSIKRVGNSVSSVGQVLSTLGLGALGVRALMQKKREDDKRRLAQMQY